MLRNYIAPKLDKLAWTYDDVIAVSEDEFEKVWGIDDTGDDPFAAPTAQEVD